MEVDNPSLDFSLGRKPKSKIDLNTNGCCFWCLRNIRNSHTDHGINKSLQFSIKSLCRYLKIDIKEVLNVPKNKLGSALNENCTETSVLTNAEVKLCSKCHKIGENFTKIYLQLEKIQIEMDHCMENVKWQITESSREPQLLQKYREKMTSDGQSLAQMLLVDNLRKQVEEQSMKIRKGPITNVHLEKCNIPRKMVAYSTSQMAELPLPFNLTDIKNEYLDTAEMLSSEDGNDNEDSNVSEPCIEQKVKCESLQTTQESDKEAIPIQIFNTSNGHFNKATGMYECNACANQYTTISVLTTHHNRKHTFKKCQFCHQDNFPSYLHLKTHLKNCSMKKLSKRTTQSSAKSTPKPKKCGYFDKDSGLYKCSVCPETFGNHVSVNDHYKGVHLSITYQCDSCQTTFKASRSLNLHKKLCQQMQKRRLEKTSGYKYCCSSCNKKFKSKIGLNTHFKRVHLTKVNCSKCDKSFSPEDLHRHEKDVHSGISYECHFCNKIFATTRSRQNHVTRSCKLKVSNGSQLGE